jgi:hypothetical protein
MGPVSRPGKGADPAAWREASQLLVAWDAGGIDRLIRLAETSKAARRGVAGAIDASARAAEVRAALADRAEDDLRGETERLLRRARGADALAQIRTNPIHRNEGFVCASCGAEVPPAPGSAVRNHCPACLCSLHVDGAVPGDRASSCHGVMRPVALEMTGGPVVVQRCARCGHERRNRLHPDWTDAPDRIDPALFAEHPS